MNIFILINIMSICSSFAGCITEMNIVSIKTRLKRGSKDMWTDSAPYLLGSSECSFCQFPVAVFSITANGHTLSNRKRQHINNIRRVF